MVTEQELQVPPLLSAGVIRVPHQLSSWTAKCSWLTGYYAAGWWTDLTSSSRQAVFVVVSYLYILEEGGVSSEGARPPWPVLPSQGKSSSAVFSEFTPAECCSWCERRDAFKDSWFLQMRPKSVSKKDNSTVSGWAAELHCSKDKLISQTTGMAVKSAEHHGKGG